MLLWCMVFQDALDNFSNTPEGRNLIESFVAYADDLALKLVDGTNPDDAF